MEGGLIMPGGLAFLSHRHSDRSKLSSHGIVSNGGAVSEPRKHPRTVYSKQTIEVERDQESYR